MQKIVVITDYANDSLYKAILDGMLLSLQADYSLSHIGTISTHSTFEAALILRTAMFNFSEDTIYMVGVSSVCTEKEGYLYLNVNNRHIFLPNNGILGLFSDILPKSKILSLPYVETTFPEIDIYLPAIQHLLAHKELDKYANTKIPEIKKITPLVPHIERNSIICSVIYVDIYGNVLTNLTEEEFLKHTQNRNFVINPGTRYVSIYKISKSYSEVENQEVFAIFNSIGLLELGIKNGSLSSSYSLSYMSNINIEIYDS